MTESWKEIFYAVRWQKLMFFFFFADDTSFVCSCFSAINPSVLSVPKIGRLAVKILMLRLEGITEKKSYTRHFQESLDGGNSS